MPVDWWRVWQVVRLAVRPAPSLVRWSRWWPQLVAGALWLLGAVGIAHITQIRLGIAWSVTLLVVGLALLLFVAAYRLHPSRQEQRRDYAESFLSSARWRGAILLNEPGLDGTKITAWSNPITNFIHHAFGKLEVDRFIAPESAPTPAPPGTQPATGILTTYLTRLVNLCDRFESLPLRPFDVAAWNRMFSIEEWRFTFMPAPEPPDEGGANAPSETSDAAAI